MKLLMLMYLEEDDRCVARLLSEHGVAAFSRFPVEGIGPGSRAGWYGEVAPYEARTVMAALPEEQAASLLAAVRECRDVQDPRHPIRAVLLPVEATAQCRFPESEAASERGRPPEDATLSEEAEREEAR